MGSADRRQYVRCSSPDLDRLRHWEPPLSLSGRRWNPKPRSKLNRPAARENRRYAPTKEGRGQVGTTKATHDGPRLERLETCAGSLGSRRLELCYDHTSARRTES